MGAGKFRCWVTRLLYCLVVQAPAIVTTKSAHIRCDPRCRIALPGRGSAATMISLQQPAHEYARLLETGHITSQELVAAFLDQIDRHNRSGINVNALLSVCPREVAIAQARQLDDERRQGKVRSDLHGIPIVLKDAIVTHPSLGMATSAGSFAIASLTAKRSAPIVDMVCDGSLLQFTARFDAVADPPYV